MVPSSASTKVMGSLALSMARMPLAAEEKKILNEITKVTYALPFYYTHRKRQATLSNLGWRPGPVPAQHISSFLARTSFPCRNNHPRCKPRHARRRRRVSVKLLADPHSHLPSPPPVRKRHPETCSPSVWFHGTDRASPKNSGRALQGASPRTGGARQPTGDSELPPPRRRVQPRGPRAVPVCPPLLLLTLVAQLPQAGGGEAVLLPPVPPPHQAALQRSRHGRRPPRCSPGRAAGRAGTRSPAGAGRCAEGLCSPVAVLACRPWSARPPVRVSLPRCFCLRAYLSCGKLGSTATKPLRALAATQLLVKQSDRRSVPRCIRVTRSLTDKHAGCEIII